jgi:hypothetical protein
MATKVVMLTAMAGAGLDLSYGDVYETDEVEAARFLEHHAAREFDEKEDANKPVKRKQDSEAIPEGHFQNDKPTKGKKKRTGQNSGDQESTDVTGESTSTSGSTDGSTGEEGSAAGELADSSSELSADAEPANAGPEDKPEEKPAQAPAPAPRPRPRR